ncbi:MAG TPA: glycosyltransferase family 4 protein [Longimicrobiales bacterium]
MRITFVLPRYGWHPSGGYKVVYLYCAELAARGHEVTVVHPRRLPPGGWPSPHGIVPRLRRLAGDIRNRFLTPDLAWAGLPSEVRVLHVPALTAAHVPPGDVIIATWWSTAEALRDLPAACGAHCYFIQGAELWFGQEDRVRATWRMDAEKIVISSWLRDLCLAHGSTPESLTVIHNGVDTQTFTVTTPPAARDMIACVHYSPDPHKGWACSLEAFTIAKRSIPSLQVIAFGFAPPPELPEWITYRRTLPPAELSSRVYNQSRVYLCSSFSEGWHLPSTEAMACGCAVVTSDIEGVRDYATDRVTARTFPAGDAAAAAARLVEVLTDDGQRMRLVSAGLERAAALSWDRSADAFESVLRRASGMD